MSKLIVACPGDPPVPGAKMVFLLDDHWYAQRFFAAHFDSVNPGPGVERASEHGEDGFRVTSEGNARLAELLNRDTRAMFFMSSDTHVKTFMPVAQKFRDPKFVVRFGDDHSAIKALDSEGAR